MIVVIRCRRGPLEAAGTRSGSSAGPLPLLPTNSS